MTNTIEPVTGIAAGVPFIAFPPSRGPRASAPVVAAWHMLDAPRTEAAFAAALPLDGLDAWRIYFGLPLTGSRTPAGGMDAVMALGYEDAVLSLDRPVMFGAAEEFGAALAELREQLGIDPGPIGVLGGSAGAAVAQLLLADSDLDIRAAVLVSPVVQERRKIEAGERLYGFTYGWSDESNAVADRLDFVARAGDIAGPPVLVVVGEEDDPGILEPAAELVATLTRDHATEAELVTVAGMQHGLAEEPGTEPAPQGTHAATVDRHAAAWFNRHLRQPPRR